MNDVVKRLRTRPTGDPHIHAMVHEAADEIERLRARNRRLEEALRWALPFAENCIATAERGTSEYYSDISKRDNARAALED